MTKIDNGIIKCDWISGGAYSDALWTQDLTSDDEDNENWQYPGEMLKVSFENNNKIIGIAVFSYLCEGHGGHLACFNIFIDEEYRRQGIATKLYDAAEQQFMEIVLPYPGNEGGAIQNFWIERLQDKPDLLEKYASNIGDVTLSYKMRY